MKMIFKPFAKKLFGVKYERLKRTLFICLIVFWGFYIADLRVRIAPCGLYLTVSVFTAGVMLQSFSSADNADDLRNMLMLPFERWKFIISYVAALGAYALLTKTSVLLAAMLAVSGCGLPELLRSLLCAVSAVLMSAGAALLRGADGYSFYHMGICQNGAGKNSHVPGRHKRASMWRYFFRYMKCHRNYWLNTGAMWCAACALPLFFRQMTDLSFVPVGFAILSMNTPVCILLSCDPALRRAVRFLPGQGKAFCAPYCLFIFFGNIAADMIFLISLLIQFPTQTGLPRPNVTAAILMLVIALFFAATRAACSVLLEWFLPVRNWKIESDLWHHPRKYAVPAVMLLLAGIAGAMLTKL